MKFSDYHNSRCTYSIELYHRVVTRIEEDNSYYPYGMSVADNYFWNQPYKFGGKELDRMNGLDLYDFGARMLDSATPTWSTPDPMAEKYYSISPYSYCMGNPIFYIDPDGRKVRIYTETNGLGHAFISVGEGKDKTVYTYGRYVGGGKGKSMANEYDPTGQGVMVRLKGVDATRYINDKITDNNAKTFIINDVDELKVKEFNDNIFNSGKNLTQEESQKYDNNTNNFGTSSNAKVIDNYNIINNNCTTKSIDAVKAGGTKIKFSVTITLPTSTPILPPPIYRYQIYSPLELNNFLESKTK